jgi:hypothetical protein
LDDEDEKDDEDETALKLIVVGVDVVDDDEAVVLTFDVLVEMLTEDEFSERSEFTSIATKIPDARIKTTRRVK